jgi:Flp pilus assembly protein TadD
MRVGSRSSVPDRSFQPDAEGVLGRALVLGDDGDWEAMALLLSEGLEADPDDPYLLCWLGVAERELGNEGAAYERFKQALAQEPDDPHLLTTAGAGLAAFDDPDAERALRTAALLAPEEVATRLAYGAYLSREGYLDDALKELEAAAELDPEDGVISTERGVAYALAGKLEEAADAFEEAARLAPGDGWPRVLLGLVLLETARPEEGAGELANGARLRPSDVEAQLLAALAAAATGWDDLAVEMIERARQIATGLDAATVEEADDRILDGPDTAGRFLRESVAPGALRDRLMARP